MLFSFIFWNTQVYWSYGRKGFKVDLQPRRRDLTIEVLTTLNIWVYFDVIHKVGIKNQVAEALLQLETGATDSTKASQWLTRDDGVLSRMNWRENQQWSWLKIRFYNHSFKLWSHRRNGKQPATGESSHYPGKNDEYGVIRNSNIVRVSGSTDFKSWLPDLWTDHPIPLHVISAPLQKCFGTTGSSKQSPGNVRLKCIPNGILFLSHNLTLVVYLREWNMEDKLRHSFFWLLMARDVHSTVKACSSSPHDGCEMRLTWRLQFSWLLDHLRLWPLKYCNYYPKRSWETGKRLLWPTAIWNSPTPF